MKGLSHRDAELVVITACMVTLLVAVMAVDYAAQFINQPTTWHGIRALCLTGTFGLLIRFWYLFAHRDEL